MASSPQNRPGDLGEILDAVRKDLLDFGLRNPLLNHKRLKSKGLSVVGERPSDIYKMLVREGKRLSFLPLGEQGDVRTGFGESIPQNSSPDFSGIQNEGQDDLDQNKYTDKWLQTGLSATELKRRLLATYYAARTSIEEQGVNTPFIALELHQKTAQFIERFR